jgi:PPOX class probable F420-dependent enzyme
LFVHRGAVGSGLFDARGERSVRPSVERDSKESVSEPNVLFQRPTGEAPVVRVDAGRSAPDPSTRRTWLGGRMARSIAKNTTVSLEDLLAFVRPRHRMVLMTERTDGSAQASPVTGDVDDSGRILVATYPERAKTRNARRTGRASVVVLSEEWNDAWVQVDGDAEVLDVPEALDAFVEYFRNISCDGRVPRAAGVRRAGRLGP